MTGQFGDTTFTKVFVGGLAWETQKDTMRKYFEQFGDILEAVVITDKATGRSKGYGFVTFREPEAAMRACADAAPVIDGRRANCNLGCLGVQRSKPSNPKHGGRNSRGVKCFPTATAFSSAAATFPPHYYAIQQGFPFNLYGYSPCSPDYSNYPTHSTPIFSEKEWPAVATLLPKDTVSIFRITCFTIHITTVHPWLLRLLHPCNKV
ncbi:hypothetical protein V6N13_106702 [Hibiscus sabdariffa]